MKIDKIELELVKNMRRFEKNKFEPRSCTLWTTDVITKIGSPMVGF